MFLFLLRDAQVDQTNLLAPNDYARRLTDEGEAQTYRTAEWIRRVVGGFDYIVSSTLPRMRFTAQVVAEACGYQPMLRAEEMFDGRTPVEALVNSMDDLTAYDTALLVLQFPFSDQLLHHLVTRDPKCQIRMQEGALACLEIYEPHVRQAVLHWLIPGIAMSRFEESALNEPFEENADWRV